MAQRSTSFAAIALASVLLAPGVLAQSQSPSTFHAAVDVIVVDVQVVDRQSEPVAGLRPEQFSVTIDGKPRQVLSADFVSTTETSTSGTPPGFPVAGALPSAEDGRVYILLFDTMSFRPLAIAPARDGAHKFVEALQPNDLVGLAAFPNGPEVQPTIDHGLLFRQFDAITGSVSAVEDFHDLSPSELVDLTKLSSVACRPLKDMPLKCSLEYDTLKEICKFEGNECLSHALADAEGDGLFKEMEVAQRLDVLGSVFGSLASSARQKIVIVISAGMLVSDKMDGRPDLSYRGPDLGRLAAKANTQVYALHFDNLARDRTTASRRSIRRTDNLRDEAILARPLEDIAGASGGNYFRVMQGGGEFAFDRILKETSAHYLLGVAPATADRDGKTHDLRVKVAANGVVVRSRSLAVLPKVIPAAATPTPATPTAVVTVKPALAGLARETADVYARQDDAALQRLLSSPDQSTSILRDVRTSAPAWRDAPRRGLLFALDLAIPRLVGGNGFVREEAMKLLAQAHLQMEQAAPSDGEFACAWFWLETAALEGMRLPGIALSFVDRAMRACPSQPRLPLAKAVLLDQQLESVEDTNTVRSIIDAYLRVDGDADAVFESRIRAAHLALRAGDTTRAFELLPPMASRSDASLQYLYLLIRGHVLRGRGDEDDAAVAYRRALDLVPTAQSARVALMALHVNRGEMSAAIELSEAVLTAGSAAMDPWWAYARGDGRALPSILQVVRRMAQ